MKLEKYLKDFDINIDWVRIPCAYRLITPHVDVVVRSGENGDFTLPIEDIAKACDDKDGTIAKNLKDFFDLCLLVHDTADKVSGKKISNAKMLFKHLDFVRILGYSFFEVAEAFHLPEKAIEILSAYWMYLGSPMEDMPFMMFGYILADYLGYSPYVPRHTSHELSLKMLEKVYEMGGQVEFRQKVDKILVKSHQVNGVKTLNGDVIKANNVISGAYPNMVYGRMIEPKNEVPVEAIKYINSMELGVTSFSINLLLDKDYKDLGIKDYTVFYSFDELKTTEIFNKSKRLDKWSFITSVCPNVVMDDASPKGTSLYTITFLPDPEAFKDVSEDNYEQYKNELVEHFLTKESERLGVNLKEHILEMEIETPVTISHYTDAYKGAIYGYRHSMDNHIAAREQMDKNYINGLYFAGAHRSGGDGMAPAVDNGHAAALEVIRNKKGRSRK